MPTVASSWSPQTVDEKSAVVRQMEQLLSHHTFRSSQRSSKFLQYIVQASLNGTSDTLKERTLGVDVFGRSPDYDTNLDHIVRTTASDVRRRIAQYYHENGHEHEIRIDLFPGSYAAEFNLPAETASQAAAQTTNPENLHGKWISFLKKPSVLIPVAIVLIAMVGLLISTDLLPRRFSSQTQPAGAAARTDNVQTVPDVKMNASNDFMKMDASYDFFWKPLQTVAAFPVFISAGGRSQSAGTDAEEYVPAMYTDSVAHIVAFLARRNVFFRFKGSNVTRIEDLSQGTAILIGGLDNPWSKRFTDSLRYRIVSDKNSLWIEDQKNPLSREWSISTSVPNSRLTKDYAIVARIINPTTGKWLVVVAGLSENGTEAASMLIRDPSCLSQLVKRSPKECSECNIEAVISTDIVDGTPAPPQILTVEFW